MQGLGRSLQLHRMLSHATIVLALQGSSRDEILRELAAHVPDLESRPDLLEELVRALREREELHSTGIGDGVALPHARQPLPHLLNQPALVFGRHPTGVAFRAVDGRPVRLFFLLLAPDLTLHLAMLARISRLLRQVTLREALLVAGTAEGVIELLRGAEARLDQARESLQDS